ncbi:hypothetical protein K8R42_04530 [bacterium]|nr:hypothetical protein [bacterium]
MVNWWSNIIEKSTGVKTGYALSAIAISVLFSFIIFILTKIGSISLSGREFLGLTAMILVALIIIVSMGKKRSPTPGHFVSEKKLMELPANSHYINTRFPNFQNLTIILALADVSDYGATANRLRNMINENKDIKSLTAIGIYGEHDFLFEVICKANKRDLVIDFITENLEVKEGIAKIPELLKVNDVAKLNGCKKIYHREPFLENGKFTEDHPFGSDVSYKTIDISRLPKSNDLLAVPYMPIIISYVWLVPKINSQIEKNAKNTLTCIYKQLLEENNKEIYSQIHSLYRLDTAILIKNVFSVEDYYRFTRFTKSIDELLRLHGYSDILQVRTTVGAEIIAWR